MARIDRLKRALGGAIKRTSPSLAALKLLEAKLIRGRVLDYGCGFGFDADHFNWVGYDPYYRNVPLEGTFDTIVCNYVLNALSRNNRLKVMKRIQGLLEENGTAYLSVPRDIPIEGKLGMNHSFQNYVVFDLPSVSQDEKVQIYVLRKSDDWEDKTRDFISQRDRRRDR
ncbi:MAG: class I SAM-dependent methyltransferase [Candidatus Obscuribacterales bacterium]|nr:class I SAM-dependent methyltransferase [Candidatus Obscuribacterales bacterium]